MRDAGLDREADTREPGPGLPKNGIDASGNESERLMLRLRSGLGDTSGSILLVSPKGEALDHAGVVGV